ncbi:class I SAM-dependent methyltransferase [Nakamurella sp. GG22]
MAPLTPDGETGNSWTWDPSLYAGSAGHYPVGRVAYPGRVADELVGARLLDGSGVLLDVGCGPGSLTLLLAPHVAEAIGVDADPDMLTEAARLAAVQQIGNVTWRHLRGEDLPADLPPPKLVTFAQSFHWMDRPKVAATVRRLLAPDGAAVHLGGTTHEGMATDDVLPHPQPPRQAISAVIQSFLGADRRAGQGVLAAGTPGDEDEVFRAAGFRGPQRLEIPGGVVERSVEEIVASVYSLSSSAPHLFGERLDAFDSTLRQLLAGTGDDGRFSEQMGPIGLSIWR